MTGHKPSMHATPHMEKMSSGFSELPRNLVGFVMELVYSLFSYVLHVVKRDRMMIQRLVVREM
jgi:hypothetical protein